MINNIQQPVNEFNKIIEKINLMENKNNFMEKMAYPMFFNPNTLSLNLINNMNENSNRNFEIESSSELCIIFRKSACIKFIGCPISIKCKSKEKISEIIKRI